MELLFHPGNYTVEFDWDHIQFRFKSTEGMFTIPIGMWYRAKDNNWVRIAGRKSVLSKAAVKIDVYPNTMFVGRFLVVAHVQTTKMSTALPIGHVYNDRKYPYKIEKKKRAWNITLDAKTVSIAVPRTPLMTLNSLPKLNKNKTYQKDIKIIIEDVPPIQGTDKDS